MTARTWETVTADDLSAVWLEYEVDGDLYVVVQRALKPEFGYVATVIHGLLELEIESPVVREQDEAKDMGVAMLEQLLVEAAYRCMTLAGAE